MSGGRWPRQHCCRQTALGRGMVAGLGVGQGMSDHGQVVVLLRQGRPGVPPPLLFQRQVAGLLPVQVPACGGPTVHGSLPRGPSRVRAAVAVQACDVFDGEGPRSEISSVPGRNSSLRAASHIAGGWPVAVVVAVQALSQQRTAPHSSTTEVTPTWRSLASSPIAVGDMGRGDVATGRRWPGSGRRAWLRGRVGAVEDTWVGSKWRRSRGRSARCRTWAATVARMEWRWSKKASRARPRRSSLRDAAGTSQRRSAPLSCGPAGDVDEGGRLAESGGEEEAQDAAVREGPLRVGGQVAVDDGSDVEALQEGSDEGQGAERPSLVGEGRSVPGVRPRASAGNGVAVDAGRPARCGNEMLGGRSSGGARRNKARRTTPRRGRGVESWGRKGLPTAPHRKTGDHRKTGCGKWA